MMIRKNAKDVISAFTFAYLRLLQANNIIEMMCTYIGFIATLSRGKKQWLIIKII